MTKTLSNRLVDTSKLLLGDLKVKSLKALVPALLQDVQDGNVDGVHHLVNLSKDKRNNLALQTVRDLEGRTVLHKAMAGGHLSAIRILIESLASDASPPAVVDAFRQKNSDGIFLLNAVDHYGNTPLMVLCKSGRIMLEATVLLLKNGARVNVVKKNTRDNPLHWAAFHGHHEVIQTLTSDLNPNKKEQDVEAGNTSHGNTTTGVTNNVIQSLWCLLKRNNQHQFPLDVAGMRYMEAQATVTKNVSMGFNSNGKMQQDGDGDEGKNSLGELAVAVGGAFRSKLSGTDSLHQSATQEVFSFATTVRTLLKLGAGAVYVFNNDVSAVEKHNINIHPHSADQHEHLNQIKCSGLATTEFKITSTVLRQYYAHWLFWSCVIGDHKEVKHVLKVARINDNIVGIRIRCVELQTSLSAACRFPNLEILATLLNYCVSKAHNTRPPRKKGHNGSNNQTETEKFAEGTASSVLTTSDSQRNTPLHLICIASTNPHYVVKCRGIVQQLVDAALGNFVSCDVRKGAAFRRKAIDLGLSVRNYSALCPIDYVKDHGIRHILHEYNKILNIRSSGIHHSGKITPSSAVSISTKTSSESQSSLEHLQEFAKQEIISGSNTFELKYIWVSHNKTTLFFYKTHYSN